MSPEPRTPLDQDALELAALYALSALSGPEMEAVEREQRGRAAFWDEVRSLRDAAAGLAETGPRAKPKRDLWPAIRARVTGAPAPAADAGVQVWKRWSADAQASFALVRGDEAAFEPTPVPGVRVRRLFVDAPADRITMLVRMDAGASYPAHRHGGVEECYVLAGDLEIGGACGAGPIEMRAGDYQRMDLGSTHAVQSTRGGCLLLIASSQRDELLG